MPSYLDVLKAHFLLLDYFYRKGEGVGGIGPRNEQLLESTVSRQATGYGGGSKWKNDFEICATLFYGIIKNHPFHDTNKRTALLVSLLQLSKFNRYWNTKQKELEKLALRTASNQLSEYKAFGKFTSKEDPEVLFIADFFRRNSSKQDTREHTVTFRELDKCLKRFDCGLRHNNKKDSVDVVKFEKIEKHSGFFFKSTTEERIITKVTTIPFRGWQATVKKAVVNRVRKELDLTHENNIDSQVFFEEHEPINSLISIYAIPLKNLANK